MAQIRPGARKLFTAMAEFVDKDNDIDEEEFLKEFTESGGYKEMEDKGSTYDEMVEDLYVLLTDKTEGEAAIRVRGCPIGNGIEACMTIYK